jgi:peptide deformylase
MILPIYGYGMAVLQKKAQDIAENSAEVQELIRNMFETMYNAEGVGLAAPQIGQSVRLFIVDGSPIETKIDQTEDLSTFKKVFVNPLILGQQGQEVPYNEGCLSIPGIRGQVYRPYELRIRYRDENWVEHEEVFSGTKARIIQHEYDHIEGVLFIEHLKPENKQLLAPKLIKIRQGRIEAEYPMKLANIR